MSSAANNQASAGRRLIVSVLFGLLAAGLCVIADAPKFAVLSAWDMTILIYSCWVWLSVWNMTPAQTRSHAVRENPGRALADVLLVSASIASLAAVAFIVVDAGNASGRMKGVEIALGLVSVVLSWAMIHTTYMLKYARLYYGQPEGGIAFNERDSPQYTDFAYLAFTLGMTFQVSDTNLSTKEIRATALKHALLSYLFGTVIIATTINTLASLSS